MPKEKPVKPLPSERALELVEKARRQLEPARVEKMSEAELEEAMTGIAGGPEQLEALKRRIMMDIFKRPPPKGDKR